MMAIIVSVDGIMENYNRFLIEFLLSLSFFVFISCSGIGHSAVSEVSLVETSDTVSFNLTPDVSTYNHTFQVFTDTDGSEYATFLNRKSSQIFVYDIAGGDPVKVFSYQEEGPNGLGTVYSHYMKSWNEFIIAGPRSIVYFLDSCAII